MRSIGSVLTGALATEGERLPGILRPDSSYAQAGAELGDFTDKVTRIAGYTELILEGYTPEKASNLLKRAHVDYDSLSDHEKMIRSDYVPFYTFTSRTLQDTGQRLLKSRKDCELHEGCSRLRHRTPILRIHLFRKLPVNV